MRQILFFCTFLICSSPLFSKTENLAPPPASCDGISAYTQNITVYLSSTGTVSITASEVDNGSTSTSTSISSLTLNKYNFDCNDLGENTITLTVVDAVGKTCSETAIVTVKDKLPPTFQTTSVDLYVGDNSTFSAVTEELFGITDNCQLYEVSPASVSFNSGHAGSNQIAITTSDNGRFDTTLHKINVNNIGFDSGDIDNDGDIDFIAGNQFFKNSGDGISFTIQNLSTEKILGRLPKMTDLDNDGDLDIILGSTVFNWNGSNYTTAQTDLILGRTYPAPHSMVADFNGDGSVDYLSIQSAISPKNTSVSHLYLNDGSGTLILDSSFSHAGSKTNVFSSGDYDEDGDVDIVLLKRNYTYGLDSLMLGTNNGNAQFSFSPLNATLTANFQTGTAMMQTKDINGDGHLDLVYSQNTLNTLVFKDDAALNFMLGNGDGSFQTLSTFPHIIGENFDAKDFDQDGDIDILMVTVEDFGPQVPYVDLYLNDGSGNFSPKISTGLIAEYWPSGSPLIMEDFNGDGFMDFTAANTSNQRYIAFGQAPGNSTDTIVQVNVLIDNIPPSVFSQNIRAWSGPNGFPSIPSSQVSNNSYDACGIDTFYVDDSGFDCSNGNNTVNLIVIDRCGNSTTTAIEVLDTIAPYSTTDSITVALDSNGEFMAKITDLILIQDNCGFFETSLDSIYFNCADIGINALSITVNDAPRALAPDTFDIKSNLFSSERHGMAVGDVDNDGDIDIYMGKHFFRNTGDGISFTSQKLVGSQQRINNKLPQLVDLDNDNDLDLILLDSVFIWDGSNYLFSQTILTSGISGSFLLSSSVADFNNDGYADYFRGEAEDSYLFLNDGNGLLVLDSVFSTESDYLYASTTGDYDNDGDIDIITFINDDSLVMMVNDGNAYFTCLGLDNATVELGLFDTHILSEDFNGDGHLDFIYNTSSNTNFDYHPLRLFLGNGNGTFQTPILLTDIQSLNFDVKDFDQDGDIDLLIHNYPDREYTVHINDGNGQFTEKATSIEGFKTFPVFMEDFNGDGLMDFIFIEGCGSNSCRSASIAFGESESGNTSQILTQITVIDTIKPKVITKNLTAQLGVNGNVTITPAQIDNGSFDNCDIDSMYLDVNNFDCSMTGTNLVTLTVIDVNGNSTSATAIVTVDDASIPTALVQNSTVQLDINGNASITPSQINNGSFDNCGIDSMYIDVNSFDCSNIGFNTVNLTVVDGSGNSTSSPAMVTVEDNINPTAVAQNLTVQLDVNGNASITPSQIDNGSFDNCAIDSMYIDVNNFDCSNIGFNTVNLTVVDGIGNSTSSQAMVTVEDNINPTAVAQNLTVQLDVNGNASITPSQIDNGSFDNCGIDSMYINVSSFDCSAIGDNTVTLTVTDVNGNSSSTTANITAEDTIAPTAIAQNISVQLNASGHVAISPLQIDFGSFDNCGIDNMYLDMNSFDCSNVGVNTVNLTVMDASGNSSSASALVTVEDNYLPNALYTVNTVLQIDSIGDVLFDPNQIIALLIDNCATPSVSFDINSFDCSNVGANTLTLTITDVNGNTRLRSANVTIEDNIAPIAIAQNLTVQLDTNGNASITAAQFDNGSYDNCTIDTMYIDLNIFDCSTIGVNTVTLTIIDVNGNSSSATANVTVEDTIAPSAIAQNVTIQLSANGNASITPAQIDNGSSDNCGIDTLYLDVNNFDCLNIGANTVNLTITDVNGNSASASATVTVEDNIAPRTNTALVIPHSFTVSLDSNGSGLIDTNQIFDYHTTDACGIDYYIFSLDNINCSNVGKDTLLVNVVDVNGNVGLPNINIITIEDNIAPVVLTNNVTLQLDATGYASITTAQMDNGSYDACGIDTMYLDVSSFNCSNIGDNVITLTAIDIHGNSSSSTATVIVEDNIAPTAIAQSITLQLDASGNAPLTAAQIDNGSFDNCDLDTIYLDAYNFDCLNIGLNTVNLTVTDVNGNNSTTSAIVTVEDNIAPTAIAQSITLQLDANGNASITTAQIDNGSFDNCGLDSLYLDTYSFNCSNMGLNTVNLTVTDVNGNSSAASAIVTVEDNIAPTTIAQNISIQIGTNGNINIDASQINNGSFDNCGLDSLYLDTYSFNCSNIGLNTVNLTVTDVNGNNSTASATVTIEDNIAPTTIAQSITLQLDANGNASITAAQMDNGSFDNCSLDSLYLDTYSFNCSNIGLNTVNLTVIDINGNSSSVSATVTIEDNIAPTAIAQNVTLQLDASGNASITAAQMDNGSFDNCSLDSLYLNTYSFNCSNIGLNAVNLTVTDVNGNSSTTSATVTVEDNIAPTTIAQNISIQIGTNGNINIDASQINNGSFDNCGIDTMYISMNSFDCSNVGDNPVILTVVDNSGNSSTDTALVTVSSCTVNYCNSAGNNTRYEWIKKIKLGSIHNHSGNNNGYADFTHMATHTNTGDFVHMKLQPGFKRHHYTEYWRVYIDWNNDGDFNDYKEKVFQGKSKHAIWCSFKAPSFAAVGNLRVRIVMKWGGYGAPCGTYNYGETEDYTLIVDNATGGNALAKNDDNSNFDEATSTLGQELFNIYPNPALSENILNLEIRSDKDQESNVYISNSIGQIVYTNKQMLREGLNEIKIELGVLSPGVYLIRSGHNNESTSFVVK